MNVGIFGGTENKISVSPILPKTRVFQSRWDRLYHLGDTDLMTEGYRRLATLVSVRPSLESEKPKLLGFGFVAEVVHLGVTEFMESVGPRLLMSICWNERLLIVWEIDH